MPSHAGVKLFNALPGNIKSLRGSKLFITKLKQYFIINSFYSLDEFMDQDNQFTP